MTCSLTVSDTCQSQSRTNRRQIAEPSVQFYEFMSLLGDRVALKGFLGYTGGLDTTRKSLVTRSLNCLTHILY